MRVSKKNSWQWLRVSGANVEAAARMDQRSGAHATSMCDIGICKRRTKRPKTQ